VPNKHGELHGGTYGERDHLGEAGSHLWKTTGWEGATGANKSGDTIFGFVAARRVRVCSEKRELNGFLFGTPAWRLGAKKKCTR